MTPLTEGGCKGNVKPLITKGRKPIKPPPAPVNKNKMSKMKLFIFEPYLWLYCGGTIGIVANTFKEAVEFIVEEDKKQAEKAGKRGIRSYRNKYFAEYADEFKNVSCDQWLLTHTVGVPEEKETKILFDNWNYA